MIKKTRIHHENQRGFTLFEMLLTVGVATTFFIFLFNIGQTIARNQAIQAAAAYVQTIEEAIEVTISDPARFNILYNAVAPSPAVGGIRQFSINDLKRQTGLVPGLPQNPLLSDTFPTIGPFGQTYVIIMRVPPTTGTERVLETYVASQTKLDDDMALRISGAIGGTGGALRDTSAVAGSTMRGAYGAWTASTNNLLASPWYANIAAQTPPTIQNGGYVLSYNYNDRSRIARDYLYRNNAGAPELNTMYTDLSMGNYNVLGANVVDSSGMFTTEELIVEGTTNLANAPTIAGSMQSDGPLALGSISSSGGGVQLSADNGNVVVNNTANAARAVFNNAFTTQSHTATAVTTEDVDITGVNFNASATNGINASAAATGLTVSGNAIIANQTQASTFTTNNLSANNGQAATITMQTSGSLTQNSGTTVTDKFGNQGRTRSSTSAWPCGNGC